MKKSTQIFTIIKFQKRLSVYLSIRHCTCQSNIDWFSLWKRKSYYPQVFLEECKYVVKEKN